MRQYLEQRVEQMPFARFQEKGYPVGICIVESACKLVVEARLKGSGIQWVDMNVTPQTYDGHGYFDRLV